VRSDHRKEAVCLSIGFPNYQMFFKYRNQSDESTTWAVLLIQPKVLWELDCAFCWANAACRVISKIPLLTLREPSSLMKLFSDICEMSGVSRSTCRIPDQFPTNPQAGVLAFSRVPLSYITAVCFEDQAGKANFASSAQGGSFTVGIEPNYFRSRCDYQVWKKVAETKKGESWQDDPFSVPF